MRKSTLGMFLGFVPVFAFFFLQAAGASDPEFEKTLKDILAQGGEPDKLYVLDGTMINYRITDPVSYTVELVLLQGEWPEPGRIQTYEARLIFTGGEYAPRFPERRPRVPTPEFIAPNSKILVLGTYLRTDRDAEGRPVLVFQGRGVRKLQ